MKKISFLSLFLLIITITEMFFLINNINRNDPEYKEISTENIMPMFSTYSMNERKTEFISEKKGLAGIELFFGTYEKVNTEIIYLELYNAKTDKRVRKVKINTSILKDNEKYSVKFRPIRNSENKKYYFKIKSKNGNENNTVALYGKNNEVFYNLGYRNIKNVIFSIGIGIFTLLINIGIWFIINKKFQKNQEKGEIKKEKLFLLLGTIYGIICIFLFPPYQTPDEMGHFHRAYGIAKGQFTMERPNGVYKNDLPDSLKTIVEESGISGVAFHPNKKIDTDKIIKALGIPLEKDKISHVAGGAFTYNPLSYIPQAIGISIGEFLNLPVLFIFYLVRIINFSLWMFLMYKAIKNIPKGKDILLILCLSPLGLQQGLSSSPDSLVNSVSFLFIAYLFKLYLFEKEKFDIKYGIIFFIGIFVPSIIKIVYILSILLLIGLPTKKFKNKKNYFLLIIGILICTLAVNSIWGKIAETSPRPTVEQVSYIKSHLFDYIKTVYFTTHELFQFYIESSIGILGWLDTRIPYIYLYGYVILLIIATFSEKILIKKDYKMFFFTLLFSLGIYGGTLTALYIIWTNPGELYIDGVQGRYFFPAIPVILFLISKKRIIINKKIWNVKLALLLNFGLTMMVFSLLKRYYI